MINENKRIEWLDGIKGIACLMVFFHHFGVGFFPTMYFGDEASRHVEQFPLLERSIAQSPLAFFLNGNFMVCLFCLASSLVLCRKILGTSKHEGALGDVVAKRYFRIVIPVFFTQLIIFVMYKAGLFCSIEASAITKSGWLGSFYKQAFTLKRVLTASFIMVPFQGDSSFNTAFWMLSQLLFGGIFAAAFATMAVHGRKCALAICACWTVGLLYSGSLYAVFIMGTMLAILMDGGFRCSKWLGGALIIAGCFLGGYPTGIQPENSYAILTRFAPSANSAATFWHQIGAVLFMLGSANCAIAQRMFSGKLVRFLGKISFSVYLIHIPLMCSFSCAAFLYLVGRGISYVVACAVVLIVSIPLLLAAAWVYHLTVEKFSNWLVNYAMLLLKKMDSRIAE